MIVSKRNDENHALIMSLYNNGIDPEGEPREGYLMTEEKERRITPLAEAGDALETYLLKEGDPGIHAALNAIDIRIAEIRSRK